MIMQESCFCSLLAVTVQIHENMDHKLCAFELVTDGAVRIYISDYQENHVYVLYFVKCTDNLKMAILIGVATHFRYNGFPSPARFYVSNPFILRCTVCV